MDINYVDHTDAYSDVMKIIIYFSDLPSNNPKSQSNCERTMAQRLIEGQKTNK